MANVVFLDYDGVVNTPQWGFSKGNPHPVCRYAHPHDNKVNDFQAVQWVSEFCQKYGYSIVVTSTWRFADNYKECLRNGGLREGIAILGKTPLLVDHKRGDEISAWLSEHPEVENYLIFDDDADMTVHIDHLVQCKSSVGFRLEEFQLAERLHQRFSTQNGGNKNES